MELTKEQFKAEILELLSTNTQSIEEMVSLKQNKFCYCIEGLIALCLGGSVRQGAASCWYINMPQTDIVSESKILYDEILPEYYYPDWLPTEIPIVLLLENAGILYLNDTQIRCLSNTNQTDHTWHYLNDMLYFDFNQFSTLINIIL